MPRIATQTLRRTLPAAMCLLLLSGCYQYKLLQNDQTTATLPETRLVYSYLWGIKSPTIRVDNCGGNGFDRVVVKTNFVNSFVTLITLGIVSPMRVYWECAPDPPTSPLRSGNGG